MSARALYLGALWSPAHRDYYIETKVGDPRDIRVSVEALFAPAPAGFFGSPFVQFIPALAWSGHRASDVSHVSCDASTKIAQLDPSFAKHRPLISATQPPIQMTGEPVQNQ